MASTGAKAKLLSDSLNRLEAARAEIQKLTGIEAPDLPRHNRDVELLAAYRIEALATWAESLLIFLSQSFLIEGFDDYKSVIDFSLADGGFKPVDAVTEPEFPFADPDAVEVEIIDPVDAKLTFTNSPEYLELKREFDQQIDAAGENTAELNRLSVEFGKKIRAAEKKWNKANGDTDI